MARETKYDLRQIIHEREALIDRLNAAAKKTHDSLHEGVFTHWRKKYRGFPIDREHAYLVREVLGNQLSKCYEGGTEGYMVVEDIDQIVAGVRLYVIQWTYDENCGTDILKIWQAIEV